MTTSCKCDCMYWEGGRELKLKGTCRLGCLFFVEKTLLPQGFTIKTNERVLNGEGIQ